MGSANAVVQATFGGPWNSFSRNDRPLAIAVAIAVAGVVGTVAAAASAVSDRPVPYVVSPKYDHEPPFAPLLMGSTVSC